MMGWYVNNRFRDAAWMDKGKLHEYLYNNWMAGEVSIGGFVNTAVMHPGAWARKPLLPRIPKLAVPHVNFIYGVHDWMNPDSGECG